MDLLSLENLLLDHLSLDLLLLDPLLLDPLSLDPLSFAPVQMFCIRIFFDRSGSVVVGIGSFVIIFGSFVAGFRSVVIEPIVKFDILKPSVFFFFKSAVISSNVGPFSCDELFVLNY